MRRSSPSSGVANTLNFVRDAILSSSGYGGGGGHMQSWRDLLRSTRSLGLTLLGAGTIGACLLFRQLSPSSALSWFLQGRFPHGSTDDPSSFDPSQLTVPGLRNSGNNCFLNAILQALASSGVVLSFLTAYNRESILSLLDGVESRCITLPLTEALSDLLAELSELDTESQVASPLCVMRALEPYAKQFDLSSQQDAAEALDYLTDALQEERLAFFDSLKGVRESISDASTRLVNGMVNEDADEKGSSPLKSWKRWPLEGTMGSLLVCQKCGFQFSTEFQSFRELLLSPPQLPDGNIVTGCNLEACLEQFTAPECITNVRCSYCSHSLALRLLQGMNELDKALLQRIKDCTFDDDCSCEKLVTQMGGLWKNVYVKAIKQLRIGRSPEVMCCQVQRVVISSSGELVKWAGHVSFPLVLNVHPYVMSSQEPVGKPSIQSKESDEVLCKCFWPKRISGVQCNFDFSNSRIPSSTDGSSSDDIHLSGSEDLASDTSSECMMGKPGDEFGEKDKEGCNITQWDSSKLNGFRDLKMYGLDTVFSSNLGQSHMLLDDKDQLLLRFREFGDGLSFVDPQQTVHMHRFFTGNSIPSIVMANAVAQGKDRELHEPQEDGSRVSQRWLYELISVVVHHGSSKGGHYTVYRRVKFKESDFTHREHLSDGDLRNSDDCAGDLMDLDNCDALAIDLDDCISREYYQATDKNVLLGSYAASLSGNTSCGLENDAPIMDREELPVHAKSVSLPEQTSCFDKDLNVKKDAHINSVEGQESKAPSEEETVLWFRVSDSHVTLVTEEEVLMAQATLLFYERSVAKGSSGSA